MLELLKKSPQLARLLVIFVCLCTIGFNLGSKFYDGTQSLLFAEFIQSSNFDQLLKDNIHTFSYRVNGGTYNLGIPFSPINETVYGTNRGVRIIPLLYLLSFLQHVFGIWWDRVYLVLILIAPLVGFFFATRFFYPRLNTYIVLVGGILFAYNPWVFSRLETGFWQLHFAYASLPLLWLSFQYIHRNLSKTKEFFFIINLAFATATVYLFQPHFLIMLLFSAVIFAMLNHSRLNRYDYIVILRRLIGSGLIFTLICGFHFIPSLLYKPYTYAAANFFHMAAIVFNGQGSTLLDVINLTPRSPMSVLSTNAWENIFFSGFFIIPIFLIIKSITNFRRDRSLLAYFMIIVIFAFLSKGLNWPFEHLSYALFKYFPPLHSFRDPSRFYSIVALFLSLSILHVTNAVRNNFQILVLLLYLIASLGIVSGKTALSFRYVQIPTLTYAQEDSVTTQNRKIQLPLTSSIRGYTWASSDNTSVYATPYEALVPSVKNLSNYSGDTDSLYSQMVLFTEHRLNDDPIGAKHLLNSLYIDEIVNDDSVIGNFESQNIAYPKAGFTKNETRNRLTSFTKPYHDDFIVNRNPIFFVGERYQYAELKKRVLNDSPVIFLNQPENSKEFVRLQLRSQIIVSDHQDSIETVFLHNLKKYSLNLDTAVRDYDLDWSPFMPYVVDEIKSGYLFPNSTPVGSSKAGDMMQIQPGKEGEYILAINVLHGTDFGNLQVQIDRKILMQDQSTYRDGFQWYIFKIRLDQSSTISFNNTQDKRLIISDALLIPESIYNHEKRLFKKILTRNTFYTIDSLTDAGVLKYLDCCEGVKYYQRSYSEWEIAKKGDWITMKLPFDYNWSGAGITGKFISEGYALALYAPDMRKINVNYEPESIFLFLLAISQITFALLVSIYVSTLSKILFFTSSNDSDY